ncbi:MAG: DUF4097 family beta strand repeat-containing protein [Pyrinomonadaceae bacterium]
MKANAMKIINQRFILGAITAIVTLMMAASSAVMQTQTRGDMLSEEFHQTYPLTQGGRVSLENINGPVHIVAWDRNEVKVDAVKRAYLKERLDEVEIRIEATADAVRIATKYPHRSMTFSSDEEKRHNNPASVDYTLTVPRNARLDTIELINGSLDIDGVAGDVHASCINGRLNARGLAGDAKLSTINGKLEANFDKLNDASTISLGSVNGGLALVIPSDANAQIKASTVHGDINNDFNLPVRKGDYVGRDMAGTIGRGGATIKLSNVNGTITIRHAPDGRPLSTSTSLLQEKRGSSDSDDNDNDNDNNNDKDNDNDGVMTKEEVEEIKREAQEQVREQASEIRERVREAADAQREAQREVERELRDSQREVERAQREVQREAIRNRQAIDQEARENAREEARAQTCEKDYDDDSRFTDRVAKSFTTTGTPRVNIRTFDGSVTVRAWDKQEVSVNAIKRANTQQALQAISVRAEQSGDEINLVAEYDTAAGRRIMGVNFNNNSSVHMDVYVPRNVNLRAQSGDGRICINGVSGELDVRTGDGSIMVRDGHGHMLANTGDGHVSITNFDGDLDARTGDGGMNLSGRFNQLSARTGDGSISLALPGDSNVTIETDSESVNNLGLATGSDSQTTKRVRHWTVGQGGKTFTLRTGDGHITLRRMN